MERYFPLFVVKVENGMEGNGMEWYGMERRFADLPAPPSPPGGDFKYFRDVPL